ncbi:hypothetical protein VSDG_02557 [Cytospora chrysosperma]|uniref:Alpha-L-rhamnosidase six-hairpin glycosidase domain-containing protein n=1 Tax=Cytospora chrysosperma TaxID=252740 RepID=A0A423WFY3_CYTCH|nr:hypothetical protein VSDG_02557 [Valsa sordida]
MFAKALTYAVLLGAACSVPYEEYILAPPSRTVSPISVYQVSGTVDNAQSLTGDGTTTFRGSSQGASSNSSVTLDFGVNIAGQVSLTAGESTDPTAAIWLTFSESSLWVSSYASDAVSDNGLDEPIPLYVGEGPGTYTVAREYARGGFRYLTLVNNGTSDIDITGVSVIFTAAPTQDLKAYTGYFHSNDELINRIWYAGAYTNQLCDIDPRHGNALVNVFQTNAPPLQTWYYNYTITNGSSCLVDGAKRDTLVWPGDIFVSGPSVAYSTYDMEAIRNSMESLLALQTSDGILPYVGVPFVTIINAVSFTYHLHNLVGVYTYYLYTGDETWLQTYWDQFKRGLAWSLSNVDSSGLMEVTSSADWLRSGMGGHNIEANAILYYVLNLGVELANVIGDDAAASDYQTAAAGIKEAANSLLWDDELGYYVDNETTTLAPQDGNSFAVLSNLTESDAQKSTISSNLQARWGTYGAPAPEAASNPATVSPFATGFELYAHLVAGDAVAALNLMRLQWGFMLDDPRMTNSTFIEGYSADGSLVYAPYPNDARISHAHGWSTGPTGALSQYVAGIHLTAAGGSEWRIEPLVGDLTAVVSGMSTTLGNFSVDIGASGNGTITSFSFETPEGTTGNVVLPSGTAGSLISDAGETVALSGGIAKGVSGGCWTYSA